MDVPHRRAMVFVDDTGEYPQYSTVGASKRTSSEASEDSYAEISSDDSYYSEGDEIAEYWDPYLYQLQLRAPKANCIPCTKYHLDKPDYYGKEYHGSITRDETAKLLRSEDGNYLVRQGLSHSGTYSLSFVFDHQVRHYRLYQDGHDHFVGEKPFETIEDLVQDGLITLYMEANNVEDYLKSARERTMTHQTQNGRTHSSENRVSRLDPIEQAMEAGHDDAGDHTTDKKSTSNSKKPPNYTRCTIPQKRDSVQNFPQGINEEESPPPEMDDTTTTSQTNNEPQRRTKKDSSSMYYHYEKSHNFKLLNNMGMSWCDHCRNFMWGLRNQGYKCKDCGYNAHKQCKDDVVPDCTPTRQLIKRVYGVELTTVVKMQNTKVPLVVRDCIEEIERRGFDVDGMYRISGKSNEVLRIKKDFDNDMRANLSQVEDVHAIAGAMKLYLRELPIPLLSFDAYDLCLIAARTGSVTESLEMLKVALSRLPPVHYNTLRYLMRHLHNVQQHKEDNRMDSKNLALVFTPSLMRSPYNTGELLAVQKLPEQKKAIDMLIQYYHSLFQ